LVRMELKRHIDTAILIKDNKLTLLYQDGNELEEANFGSIGGLVGFLREMLGKGIHSKNPAKFIMQYSNYCDALYPDESMLICLKEFDSGYAFHYIGNFNGAFSPLFNSIDELCRDLKEIIMRELK